jgi:hypothetical protein
MTNDVIHLETLLDLIHKLDGVTRIAADLRKTVEAEMRAARRREQQLLSAPAVLNARSGPLNRSMRN